MVTFKANAGIVHFTTWHQSKIGAYEVSRRDCVPDNNRWFEIKSGFVAAGHKMVNLEFETLDVTA